MQIRDAQDDIDKLENRVRTIVALEVNGWSMGNRYKAKTGSVYFGLYHGRNGIRIRLSDHRYQSKHHPCCHVVIYPHDSDGEIASKILGAIALELTEQKGE